MSNSKEDYVRLRQPTLPPISNRTLHHPSFLPLYLAADFGHHHTDYNNDAVHPIIPAEFFYSDPTNSCGKRRIPNIVSELRVFDCFQLNTPMPVMSASPAPPACPDPFVSEPHSTRDLGSLTFKTNTLLPPVQPSRIVLQLTQEEDQTITNLLKLHYQEPIQSEETLTLNPEPMDSAVAEEVYKPLCRDVQYRTEASARGHLQQGRCWSDTEIGAANTLLRRFSLMEKDKIWDQSDNKRDFLFCQLPFHEEISVSSTLRLPSLSSDIKAESRSSVSSEGKKRTLSDSEEDAVHVLLSLREMGSLDIRL